MTNIDILHHAVNHYLRHCFVPILIENEEKVKYMMTNAFRMSLGRSYDHSRYCLFLASHGPNYGVIVNTYSELTALKAKYRKMKWAHTQVSSQVQLKVSNLAIETQVLVIMNASNITDQKTKIILRSWTTEKPVLMIG